MTLTVYVLLAMMAVQQVAHYIERRDLYTRLMSNNLSDYKNYQEKESKRPVSAHRRVLKKWRGEGGDSE